MADGIAHGGRLIEARRQYPQAPSPFLDLSTGINPHAYPLAGLDEADYTRLPEPERVAELQAVAARAYGAGDASMVVAAPGTQILISLLAHLLGLRRAVILGPTYDEHRAAWHAAGAEVCVESDSLRFAALACQPGTAAILCNPNNPDGRLCDAAWLLALARNLEPLGGILIVDEAFADLQTPDPGLSPYLPEPGLLVLRSFGKSYGLAGLRLGFLLAAPALAARIRGALGPWAVSGPALRAGIAALPDQQWRMSVTARLQAQGDRLDRLFIRAGCTLIGGTRLFRLFRSSDAWALHTKLAAKGILTRRFESDPRLLRVGLAGSDSAWSRLEAALSAPVSHS